MKRFIGAAITDLQSFQRLIAKALIILAVVHVPLLTLLAALRGFSVLATLAGAAALAVAPAVLYGLHRPLIAVAFAVSATLVGQTSLLVFLMKGHPWQVEMHFYYFAVLAMLGGFCGWRAVLFAAGLIAGQHLVFNWLLPEAVFPGGSNFARVMVHAAVVVVETVMLIGISLMMRIAFERAQSASAAAEAAAAEIKQTALSQEALLRDTTARANHLTTLIGGFESEMSSSIGMLHNSANALLGNADSLGAAAAKASAQVVAVSAVSEETAHRVQRVAQAGEELALTINEVGASATKSSELAAAAVAEAERTSATMDEMAAVAAEISHVTELINGIAAQTNLLALNATIEAARAGEAGRGFSVVAQEVKALSTQTAKATQEIAERIAAMQNTSNRSVEAIARITKRICELDDVATSIAAAVEEQATATQEIAGNVSSAAAGVGHVEQSIAEIEALSTNNTAAVAQVSTAAHEIAKQTSTIRERVRAFTGELARVRA